MTNKKNNTNNNKIINIIKIIIIKKKIIFQITSNMIFTREIIIKVVIRKKMSKWHMEIYENKKKK